MIIKPNLQNSKLTRKINGFNENLCEVNIDVIEEKPLTNERNNSKYYYAYRRKQQYTNSDKLAQQLFNKIKDPKDFIYF